MDHSCHLRHAHASHHGLSIRIKLSEEEPICMRLMPRQRSVPPQYPSWPPPRLDHCVITESRGRITTSIATVCA
jgi:hypothetical protein